MRDGSTARLRLVRPSDRPLLVEGFAKLSPESVYQRFFSAKTRLSEREVDYLTNVDQEHHFAIGAISDDDHAERGLGVARFVVLEDDCATAEVAITIIDQAQDNGLGTILLGRLYDAALERGVTRFRFQVLADNQQMHDVLRDGLPEARGRPAGGRTSEFDVTVDGTHRVVDFSGRVS